MCNFLRRPGDYGGTNSSGYLRDVVVHSSIPDVVVSYSTTPSASPALKALRTFIAMHPSDIDALQSANPVLHSLLLRLAEEDK